MSLGRKIMHIYNDIKLPAECHIQNDGEGEYIKFWNYAQPQPTQQELDAVDETQPLPYEIKAAQKAAAIVDNLPSWSQVKSNINNISNLTEAKAFLLKLSRVVYWDIKDEVD